ncbi:hypothetical protein Ancab_019303 [Ancistrocladus abbreviatus]
MQAVRQLVEEKPVVIFSKSNCCVSYSMRQLISSYGANPTVYELNEIPNGQELERALQSIGSNLTVPVVFIGQKLVGGADEVISLQVQGKLVQMLMEAGAIGLWNRTSASSQ